MTGVFGTAPSRGGSILQYRYILYILYTLKLNLWEQLPPRSNSWLAKKNYCAAARGARRDPWIGHRPLPWALAGVGRVPADQQRVQGVSASVRRHASLPGGGSRPPMPRSSKNGSTARLHPEPCTAWRGAARFLPSIYYPLG